MKELLIMLILTVVITVGILLATGSFRSNHSGTKNTSKLNVSSRGSSNLDDPNQVRSKYGIKPGENYILPQEFKVGLVKPRNPLFMNNCNPNVLYPINGLGPDYGWKMPNCRCTEFVQAP